MVVKVNLPDVKQPITDPDGYITKAFFDFLRRLYERTGGSTDAIAATEEDFTSGDLFTFRNRLENLERRVRDLEQRLDALGLS